MAKKNNKTTNQNLKDEYKKKYASSKELSDASKSDMSRASSIIPASALYESIRRSEKRMSSNSESVKNTQPIRGIIDWTNGSTQGWDLLTSQSLPKPSFVGLLDTYGGAAAAYSLRRLSSTYTGDAIRVRESGGNTELDIGFDVNGDLDTTALLAHCGAGDGFVVTKYDQSGNGHDLTQATTSKQPKIVNSGALYTFNSKPYTLYDGIDDVLRSVSSPVFGTDPRSLFLVQKTNVVGISGIFNLSADTGVAGRTWLITPEVATRTNSVTWVSSTPASIINPSLISNIYTTGDLFAGNSMWLDGVSVARTSGNNGSVDSFDSSMTEGANGESFFHDGYISEVIIYKSNQTSNRDAIESNQASYYGITL